MTALAAPAWGADATLEGYGGDGALLVGIDSDGSPFGGSGPAQREGGGAGGGRDDGNLVAESVSTPVAGAPGATQPPPATTSPGPAARSPRDGAAGRKRDRGAGRSAPQVAAPEGSAPQRPPAPGLDAGAEASGGGVSGLPLMGAELALFFAALLGLAAMGAGMRKLAESQPQL